MGPTTLAYVVLLLLLGIHYQNVYVLATAFLYFIVMLVLEPYMQQAAGSLELVSILTIALLWMILVRVDVKRLEPFIETVQTRPCQIYFTDKTAECDRGDFSMADAEFDEKYPSSEIIATRNFILVHYKFEDSLISEVNPGSNRLDYSGNIVYGEGKNGGKALWLKNEANVSAGRAAANYVMHKSFSFPAKFTIAMHLKFTKFDPKVRQNVVFATNIAAAVLTRSLVLYVYNGILYCTLENIPGAAVGSYPIVQNIWYDITITYDANVVTLFVNGENTGSKTYTPGFTQNGGFILGNDSTTAPYPFAGYIDDFRIYSKIVTPTSIPKNAEVKNERLRLQGICKQEFPGWIEAANQPIKQPKELAIRGNLRDWAFCYKPLFVPTSTALYNKTAVEANFNSIKAQFNSRHASYNLIDLDKEYVPVPENTNLLRYNQATPEYIRMYFKSPIETFVGGAAPIAVRAPATYASSDINATCDNATVSYTTQFAPLPPQYGMEIKFVRNDLTGVYSVSGINCIRTASSVNANQFMYVSDVTKLLPYLFNIETDAVLDKVYLVGKSAVNGTIYKFDKDICGRLVYKNKKTDKTFNLASYQSRNLSSYLYDGSFYKFNVLEPMTNTKIIAYDEAKLLEQNTKLLGIPNDTSPVSSRNGFMHKVFMLSHDFDNYKVRTKADMDRISVIVSGVNILDQSEYKFLEHRIYKATTDNKLGLTTSELPIHYKKGATNSIYQSFEGYLNMSPVITTQPYQFRLFIDTTDRVKLKALYNTTEDKRPLRYYMDLSINGVVITHFYYCPAVDDCINVYNTNYCMDRQRDYCKIPEWSDYFPVTGGAARDTHHNPAGSAILSATSNTIQVRIFTNANLTDPTPFCRITYKAPGQTTFKLIEDAKIYYSKSDYASYVANINRSLIEKVNGNKRAVTDKMLDAIARDYEKAIPFDKSFISTNNRAYIFFRPAASIAAADLLAAAGTETSNIQTFSTTAFSPN